MSKAFKSFLVLSLIITGAVTVWKGVPLVKFYKQYVHHDAGVGSLDLALLTLRIKNTAESLSKENKQVLHGAKTTGTVTSKEALVQATIHNASSVSIRTRSTIRLEVTEENEQPFVGECQMLIDTIYNKEMGTWSAKSPANLIEMSDECVPIAMYIALLSVGSAVSGE